MRLVGVFAPATDHDRLTQLNHDDVGHTGRGTQDILSQHRTQEGHLISTQDTGRGTQDVVFCVIHVVFVCTTY